MPSNTTIRFSDSLVVSLNIVEPLSTGDIVGSCTIDNEGESYTYKLVLKKQESEGEGGGHH